MKVVLIEDNLALRGSLADFLSVKGHQVWEVGEAIEFYQLLSLETFDVAIVDVNLPDYDGFSITRYLSSKNVCPVIMTSVRASLEDRVKGYDVGADIYMTKPVDPEELAAAIEMIGRRSAQEAVVGAVDVQEQLLGWRLEVARQVLWAPDGQLVSLTKREMRLIYALAEQESGMIDRSNVERVLGGCGGAGRGRVDTFLSRLRSKVRDKTGQEFPLVTNRSHGFSFLASIEFL